MINDFIFGSRELGYSNGLMKLVKTFKMKPVLNRHLHKTKTTTFLAACKLKLFKIFKTKPVYNKKLYKTKKDYTFFGFANLSNRLMKQG